MSTSGGGPAGFRKVIAGRTYLLTPGPRSTAATISQELLSAPVYCPFPVTITGMGVNVTGAGGAGATVQPAIYGLAADGSPGALLIAGPVLAAAAVAAVSGPVAGVIPAGWSWVALLPLAATAPAPTISIVSGYAESMFGMPVPDTGVGAYGQFPLKTLQAALPANFAAVGSATVGPAVWVTT